jgi:hypothetical protein
VVASVTVVVVEVAVVASAAVVERPLLARDKLLTTKSAVLERVLRVH